MSSSIHTLFFYHYLSVCIAITIEWKPWINLPIQNSQILATTYQHSIVIIGGTQQTNTVYKINSSATIKSNKTWQNLSVQYPGLIVIKNDNFLTNGPYTNIFGVPVNNKHKIYTYDHTINQFVQPQFLLPPQQAAHPCVVAKHPFIYLIGGITSESSDSITCLSTTLGYNFHTNAWQTYSSHMPWDNNIDSKYGACYNLCQEYGGFIYLFGGVIGGDFPTYLPHVYALDIRNGPNFGMKWEKVSNISIDKGIINTHSLLVKDTIYTFADAGVQSIQLSETDPKDIKINIMENDNLTPPRCATGNVYDTKTNYIYAIGGCDCNSSDKLYFNSQISQNMTVSDSGNDSWWDLNVQDWMYFGIGFIVAIMFVCVCTYCHRHGKKSHGKHGTLIGRHLQDSNGNRTAFSREGSDTISSILAQRPQVDI